MQNRSSTQGFVKAPVWAVLACLSFTPRALPDLVSSLFARGYSLIPEPQQVKLGPDDFRISAAWRVESGLGVEAGSPAEDALREGLEQRHAFKLTASGSGPAIRLEIQP